MHDGEEQNQTTDTPIAISNYIQILLLKAEECSRIWKSEEKINRAIEGLPEQQQTP